MAEPITAAITAWVASAGAAIGGTTGAFLIMNAVAVGTTLFYTAAIASSIAIGAHQRRKAIAAYNKGLRDRLIMQALTDGARSLVYGRVRVVDGVVFKASHGSKRQYYTLVIALGQGPIDGVETIYFNDVPLTLDADGYVQTAPYAGTDKDNSNATVTLSGGSGSVTLPRVPVAGSVVVTWTQTAEATEHAPPEVVSVVGQVVTVTGWGARTGPASVSYQWITEQSRARVRAYNGEAGQDLSVVLQPLVPDMITGGAHRFAGIACLVVTLTYNVDAYPSGLPAISAVVRGRRVLDPRTGVTAWSENTALIARDWALHPNGGGLQVDNVDAAAVIAAANACDVSTNFAGPSGTRVRPLYTCGIVCSTANDPWLMLQEIVESMAGKAGWAGGVLRIVAGAWRAPVATIDESWISGAAAVQIVPEVPADEAVNVYRATIANAAADYVAAPAPRLVAAAYVSADGRELQRDIELGGVTDTDHAQHVCGVLMREQRNGLTVVLPCNLRAMVLELFDVVYVTLPRFGWAAKTFEVVDWGFSLDGAVNLTLRETSAAIYNVDSTFAELDLTPNTALPDPTAVPVVGTLTVSSGTAGLSDQQTLTRTLVQWPAVDDQAVNGGGRIEVAWWDAATSLPTGDWPSQTETGGATSTTIVGLRALRTYLFRARAITALGVHGAWSVMRAHQVAAPPKVPAAQIAEAAVLAAGEFTDDVGVTFSNLA